MYPTTEQKLQHQIEFNRLNWRHKRPTYGLSERTLHAAHRVNLEAIPTGDDTITFETWECATTKTHTTCKITLDASDAPPHIE